MAASERMWPRTAVTLPSRIARVPSPYEADPYLRGLVTRDSQKAHPAPLRWGSPGRELVGVAGTRRDKGSRREWDAALMTAGRRPRRLLTRLELRDQKRGEIVNYLDFDRHLIGQRNAQMQREVRALRLGGQLRKNRRARSDEDTPPHTNNLTWRSVLSLVRGEGSPQ